MKKEFLHPLFAIGKTVPNKCQITAQLRIGRDRMVCVGIERVVDGKTSLCAQARIVVNNRLSSTIGEDQIVVGNEFAKRILRHILQPR